MVIKIITKYLFRSSIFLFIALITIFPFQFYYIKGAIFLLFLLVFIIKTILRPILEIKKDILFLFLLYSFIGLLWVVYGTASPFYIEGSILYTAPLYVLFPLIYLLLTIFIGHNKNLFSYILSCLEISFYLCIMYIFYLFGSYLGYFPIVNLLSADSMSRASLDNDNSTEVVYHGITSLAFLTPFYLSKTLISKFSFISYIFRLLITTLSIIAIFLAGRRAIILIIVISPIILLLFTQIVRKKYLTTLKSTLFKIGLTILSAVSLSLIMAKRMNISFSNTFTSVITGLNISSNSTDISTVIRAKQAEALFDGFLSNPLFGHGYGTAAHFYRKKGWRYELSYLSYMFHIGLIGSFLLLFGTLYIYINILKKPSIHPQKSSIVLPLVVGTTCVLLAYSSNPYLDALDVQWTFYILIIYLNADTI